MTVLDAASHDGLECPGGAGPDVTWLLHRAAQRLRIRLDAEARRWGLGDSRDWAVLTAITDGGRRSQLALGQELGVDKTTLTSILDRLEREGLIVRTADPRDRRVKQPETTEAGATVQQRMRSARDEFEKQTMADFSDDDREAFMRVLTELAHRSDDGDPSPHGSCM
ncbi:MarR family winged helix-turn-helix transcriptional regulator [Stackebrandtia endophytica]|nr:MarR family transcriptional regulator [Stackebrandtia endophytica]